MMGGYAFAGGFRLLADVFSANIAANPQYETRHTLLSLFHHLQWTTAF